ncbi:MAG TPA: L,D-transpeptidase [Holophagaceae bacterium]|nr:L,D-transpeptidase [Holophagaceae bacterium]
MHSRLAAVLLALSLASVPGKAKGAQPAALKAARARVEAMARQAGVTWPLASPNLRILKAKRALELWSEGHRLATYRVGLGAAPSEDKVREGDHRTPVGSFYVCTRNRASAFHLFLGISYPHGPAAARGLKAGLISPAQHRAITGALARRETPPQFTKLGGLVGIHGGGAGSDWTWGCIALANADIEELWEACPLGTPVEVLP